MQMHGDMPCAKLNSVIRAIGVLSLVPDLAVQGSDPMSELSAPPIPTSLVRDFLICIYQQKPFWCSSLSTSSNF